jgi:hypothetical protein
MAVQMRILSGGFLTPVRHLSFWITEGIGLTGVFSVFLTSGTKSVGKLPYEFMSPFSHPYEKFTNFNVFGLDLM